MTRKSIRVFVQILMLGLLLGVSSTAYADAFSITTVSFSNFQIAPATGTVTFTPTSASAVALATNSLGQSAPVMSSTLPIAQANTSVLFASSSSLANTTNFTSNASSSVSLTGCTCQASSAGQGNLSATFVIVGGDGNVNVNISGLFTTLQSIVTDELGLFSQSQVIMTLTLDGVPLFDVTNILNVGTNLSDDDMAIHQVSEAVSLQFNVPHTISLHIHAGSLAGNEIPEPATMVLLVSGLGFMAGFVKKRRK